MSYIYMQYCVQVLAVSLYIIKAELVKQIGNWYAISIMVSEISLADRGAGSRSS